MLQEKYFIHKEQIKLFNVQLDVNADSLFVSVKTKDIETTFNKLQNRSFIQYSHSSP